jgi:hypothetical protein
MREFWGWVVFALAVGLILAGYLWEPPAPRHVPAASVAATPCHSKMIIASAMPAAPPAIR